MREKVDKIARNVKSNAFTFDLKMTLSKKGMTQVQKCQTLASLITHFNFQDPYSSSDEESGRESRNNNSVIRRSKPRLVKSHHNKSERNRKISTPATNHYSMTCLERLIRAHPIWFLPKVNREEASHLLQGKETGVS